MRTEDIRLVIDQLARPAVLSETLRRGVTSGAIDVPKVAEIGHSFGGAVSLQSDLAKHRTARSSTPAMASCSRA